VVRIPGRLKILSRIPSTMAMMMLKRKNIQYSFLRALPLNTAYFFNTSRYQFILPPFSLFGPI
jgi:hypothetical protein